MKLINDGDTLNAAKRGNYAIPTYDDGYGKLYIHRNSIGISGIVRAQTWEDAYSICEDEFFPDADETEAELIAEFGADYPDNACFQEQYGYRNNTGGADGKHKSSLYSKDLNGDSLDVLTPALLEALEIELDITYDWYAKLDRVQGYINRQMRTAHETGDVELSSAYYAARDVVYQCQQTLGDDETTTEEKA